MGMIGDVLAAIKATSEWKALLAASKQIPELEQRIAALEQRLAGGGAICPSCGKYGFMLESSKSSGPFGRLGVNSRTYRCTACGFSEDKIET